MIETWVLVLSIGVTVNGPRSITAVPGYESRRACEIAGDVWAAERARYDPLREYDCIPGPKK
jgi:hypothetical protein